MTDIVFVWKVRAVSGRGYVTAFDGITTVDDLALHEMSVKLVAPKVWQCKVDNHHLGFSDSDDEARTHAEDHCRMLINQTLAREAVPLHSGSLGERDGE